jgi:transcriptional regulator
MNHDDCVDLHALKQQGWTNKEIAEELGYYPGGCAVVGARARDRARHTPSWCPVPRGRSEH